MTPLPLFGMDLSFPGYLIVGALLYALIGTLIAHWIGWRLIPLNFSQQRFESDFRFAIVRAADHSEPVALMQGESVERAELQNRFSNLVRNWTALGRAADQAHRIHRRLCAGLDRRADPDQFAGLSRRRHSARLADAIGVRVPARGGRLRVLPQRLQQARGMEGVYGSPLAIRAGDERRSTCSARPARA